MGEPKSVTHRIADFDQWSSCVADLIFAFAVKMPAAVLLVFTWLVTTLPSAVNGQDSSETTPTIEQLQVQLNEQAAQIRELHQLLEPHNDNFGLRPDSASQGCTSGMIERLPLVVDLPVDGNCDDAEMHGASKTLDFYAGYDRGFVIRPFDARKHPFDLKANGWIQFRYHGFSRQSDRWTDNAGITRPIQNRSAFDIERARLVFRGHAVDPRLTYFLQIDGDTDDGHAVDFFDYWWAWQLTDRFQILMGKRKVPASRQWLLPARRTRFADRPMANDFFRPDRTVGIFGIGRFAQHGHYRVMVGNGYRTANLPNASTDNRVTFAATSFIEPAGDFGGQIVDFDQTQTPLWRLGHSFVYSPQTSQRNGTPLDETDFVRLADGTRLTETGALLPGVTVSAFDIWLYGVDAAWKHKGWSVTSEVFLRWIENLRGDGTLPTHEIFQQGYYVEGGKFLVAKQLDVNVRYSHVDGEFGNANEYAAGLNWYPLAKPTVKITFDVTRLDGSPLQNRTSDIVVGDDGVLFRTQFQAEF
ncbi:OprO/OprP family phosphate-selective porin [Stieleria sp. TO1_6]|uniref:porin n=1 Tax=Stieleria tagensis TaxID=2956795 RepID=UPI00209B1556|nr:porin [Stieleria tagensis]MCO8120986.1 OprO/OprP family phosphate-selective porin [Stieleria tagensis]